MSKVISAINITPDGFCGHTAVVADEEHHKFAVDLLKTAGTVIFGRITYKLFESYWPLILKDTNQSKSVLEFAEIINSINKVVFSRSVTKAHWNNTAILPEISKTNIELQKQKSGKNVLIFGSPGIVAELTRLRLIDEYYFMVQPMIAGSGKRFFETIHLSERHNLKLADTKVFKSGVITLSYINSN